MQGLTKPSGDAPAWERLSAILSKQSFQHHPLPLFSSFSTELTFKLWHQLPCQTRCDFPLLHLPCLSTGAVSHSPPSFLLCLSLSSASISCLPLSLIHKISATQAGSAAGGISIASVLTGLHLPAFPPCSRPLLPGITSAQASLPARLETSPGLSPPMP